MNISDLRKLTLREIARALREGETSPTEIVQILLDQIRFTEDKVKAYVTVCENAPRLAEAAEVQIKEGHDLGPLHGIPVSIKDVFETAGIPTTCCSKLMQDYVPTKDSTVVKRLKMAGSFVLGKLTTHEFALGTVTPPTRNPWNLKCIPGGSSGGSGASIAASSAIATVGSDTLGSIRIPSSFCGVVGLKPTYSRVSRNGLIPESWSLDHAGPIGRRVEDVALLLSLIAGHDELDPTSSRIPVPDYVAALSGEIRGIKIGVPKNHFFDHCERETEGVVRSAIDLLMELGGVLVEFEFPYIPEIIAAYTAIEPGDYGAFHQPMLAQRANDYTSDVRTLIEQAMFIPATYYVQAQRVRARIFPEVVKLFKRFDVIVTPTQPMVAPQAGAKAVQFGDFTEDTAAATLRYVGAFNLTGLPALSVPCGFSRNLPVGMQIVGKPFDEATVLRVGDAYERATPWHAMFPQII